MHWLFPDWLPANSFIYPSIFIQFQWKKKKIGEEKEVEVGEKKVLDFK